MSTHKGLIRNYQGTHHEDQAISLMLNEVYVKSGFTAPSIAATLFLPAELRRRGDILLARSEQGALLGMVICAASDNPYRQISYEGEAEMHLLAVTPEARGKGIGRRLCQAFEQQAKSHGYKRTVLSTQPTMHAAHKLYESMGYQRNSNRDWLRVDREFLVYEKVL